MASGDGDDDATAEAGKKGMKPVPPSKNGPAASSTTSPLKAARKVNLSDETICALLVKLFQRFDETQTGTIDVQALTNLISEAADNVFSSQGEARGRFERG